ncbi:carbohydrate ABC transporter permease [Cellulomonas citrea]|uniref:carbohydrate ABC transporter permease n=1 Tax=Cellulomonas citrea TaxID=1909423 RepID=UPI00135CF5E6|nr:carbohydrate ABC transporter permease [Cellulomonas citrea]
MSTIAAARPAALRPPGRRRVRPGRLLASGVGVLVALAWAFPVYWMVDSSFMSSVRLQDGRVHLLPVNASWDNYASVWASGSFLPALRMSLAVTFLTLLVTLVFAFLAALAISRFRFRGRRGFILAVLLIQMLPAEGLFIAQYRLVGSLHLLNTVLGVSILYIAAVVPFTVWMLRGFVAGVPIELEEAAMVDGLSRTQAFVRITFPLLAPGLVASGVYAFLQAWNEFTVALVVLQSDASKTLPIWLRSFVQASASRDTDWGQVMAASSLIAVPVIVFFLFVQGRMTSGLVSGAVKG